MPAVINSAPDCVTHEEGYSEDDAADFILNDNYVDCAGFMTFGPGSTYGPDGVAGATSYYILTWVGIAVVILVIIGWIVAEHRELMAYAANRVKGGRK